MGYSQVALEDKILEMYPEIRKHDISLTLSLDRDKNVYIVGLQKGDVKRYAFLDKKDADSCMDGNVCIYLGFLMGQYISDIERELRSRI